MRGSVASQGGCAVAVATLCTRSALASAAAPAGAAPPPQNRTYRSQLAYDFLGAIGSRVVNFSNALRPLDERGGLLRGVKAVAR